MFAQYYIFFVISLFIFIMLRHVYLLRIKLTRILKKNHMVEWDKIEDDTGWLTPTWSSIYRTKAFYDFVWHSNDDLNDNEIKVVRKKLKRIVYELIIAFITIMFVTVLLINLGILR